jgi:Ulp1 family protease
MHYQSLLAISFTIYHLPIHSKRSNSGSCRWVQIWRKLKPWSHRGSVDADARDDWMNRVFMTKLPTPLVNYNL